MILRVSLDASVRWHAFEVAFRLAHLERVLVVSFKVHLATQMLLHLVNHGWFKCNVVPLSFFSELQSKAWKQSFERGYARLDSNFWQCVHATDQTKRRTKPACMHELEHLGRPDPLRVRKYILLAVHAVA